jgi:GT2 family glycosyltransferase
LPAGDTVSDPDPLEPLPPTTQQPRHLVTAVIVAHDGARLLPGLVRGLRSQTYPIQRAVGVDTGSSDRSGAVLSELIGPDSVFGMDRTTGYPAAIAAALANPAASRGGLGGVEWIWLLHDDCEPAPDTLERLLRAAVKDRKIAVVGPKVLDLPGPDGADKRVLREAGVSIDRAGRRITGIEPGEIDQGQHDGTRGVLAVGSAGMLVRRDVWERVGGFDSNLTLFRDDVDFCWRVHAAGYRVQVVTDALLYHRELGFRRVRNEAALLGGRAERRGSGRRVSVAHPRRLDRRNALYVLAANLPLLAMLRTVAGFVAGSLLRAAWFVVSKQTGRAGDQMAALAGVLAHPVMLWKARSRRRRTRRAGYAAVRGFMPASRTLSKIAESVAGMVSKGPPVQSGGHHATEDLDEEQFTDEQSLLRKVIALSSVRLLAALLLVTGISERRLIGTGIIGGGALVPTWGGTSGLWQIYLDGFHATGIGSSAIAPPYLAVVAALGWVTAGKSAFAVDLLLLGCVPLAGMTAYLASRRVVRSSTARTLGAAAYALLPVGLGAVAAGRLGTAVVLVLLPLIGMAAGRMLTNAAQPRIAGRAAWATGLLAGVAAAFVPMLWILTALLAGGVAGWAYLARRQGWRAGVTLAPLNAVIIALTPVLVLFPWSLSLILHPGGFLLEAGIARPGLSSAGMKASSLLLLHPGGPGLPPAWMSAGLCLAVLGLLVPSRRRVVSYAGWLVAITGLIAAVVVSGASITSEGLVVPAWPGPELAVASAGLVLASLPLIEWLVQQARSAPKRVRRVASIGALAVLASTPVLVAGYWLVSGIRGPVTGARSGVLPAFVSVAAAGPQQPRTLVLRASGGSVTYTVLRASDPSLGEPELAAPGSAVKALDGTVAALVSPGGEGAGDPSAMLAGYGIKWVMLPGPVNPALAQQLDGASGLTRVSTSPAYDMWQVAGTVASARVVEPGGAIVPLASSGASVQNVAAPASGGTLLLAEPAGGWTATLNGRALTPSVYGGWEQAFTLPAGGGKLSVYYDQTWRELGVIAQALALLAVTVLALPGKRTEVATAIRPSSRLAAANSAVVTDASATDASVPDASVPDASVPDASVPAEAAVEESAQPADTSAWATVAAHETPGLSSLGEPDPFASYNPGTGPLPVNTGPLPVNTGPLPAASEPSSPRRLGRGRRVARHSRRGRGRDS